MLPNVPGLKGSSLRLLQHGVGTRRRRNSFACRVLNNGNLLSLAVASVPPTHIYAVLHYKSELLTPQIYFPVRHPSMMDVSL